MSGLVVAALVQLVFPGARGSGINQTKAALYIYNGYISFRTVIGKFITSALAIGGGFSLGPEDPSLQIGAGVASMVSRRLNLSRERLRMFAPIGAAAGLAAAFNAPISAILFVVEEVIGRWSAAVLGSIVLSAISSVVVARWFWGAEPMFRIPLVTLKGPAGAACLCGAGRRGWHRLADLLQGAGLLSGRVLRRLAALDLVYPAPIAGLIVGAIAFFGAPQVMGPGLQRHRPGDARPVHLEVSAGAGFAQDCGHDDFVFQRHAGWDVRSHALYWSDAGRLDRNIREDFLPQLSRFRSVRMRWWAWGFCSPHFYGFR